jgi:hypothetical protein
MVYLSSADHRTTLSRNSDAIPAAVQAFESPKPAVFTIAATTSPEIASIHATETVSVSPSLAEMR